MSNAALVASHTDLAVALTAYKPTEDDAKKLQNRFTYHAPKGDQAIRYTMLRDAMKDVARLYVTLTPPSREQSLALTKLEESSMWANAAIARNE